MKYVRFIPFLLVLLWSGTCPAAEPVIGGPCDGCEFVFDGFPAPMEAHSRIAPAAEEGDPLVIEGIVRRIDGTPAPGIIIYAYQTDDHGIYPKGTNWHGRLRGWTRTDQGGKYRFDTIRPGAYPTRGEPEHIHMHVIEPGKATYYIDNIVFDDDELLTEERRRRMRERAGSGLTHPKRDEDGTWRVRRDIILGKNIPGYR